MPPNTVCVTRGTRYGNPYRVGWYCRPATGEVFPHHQQGSHLIDVEQALLLFRNYAEERLGEEPGWLEPLRGKNLACFCRVGELCHADVLLELANA